MRRARPPLWLGPRGIALLVVLALAAGALAQVTDWRIAVAAGAACALLSIAFDARAGRAAFAFERRLPERFVLGRRDALTYDVVNRGSDTLRFRIFEGPVDKLALDLDGAGGSVAPHGRTQASLAFVPAERGPDAFSASFAWYESSLGLVRHRVRRDATEPLRVLPAVRTLDDGDDLALRARRIDAGLRRLRQRGTGTEFESLRDYAAGDPYRAIDWNATARRGRVMVAQHEVERSQQIVLAVDAGRLMAARVDEQRKLDYAVAAALAIAALARRAGDRVGIHAFAGTTLARVAPQHGAAGAAAIRDALTDLAPHDGEPDYERAVLDIGRTYRKRSLVVVFTDLFDPVASRVVLGALAVLVRRHVVVVALMNDAAIADALVADVPDVAAAYRAAVATSLAAERERAVAALRARGMIVIDVPARALRPAVLDAYVAVKSRGAL